MCENARESIKEEAALLLNPTAAAHGTTSSFLRAPAGCENSNNRSSSQFIAAHDTGRFLHVRGECELAAPVKEAVLVTIAALDHQSRSYYLQLCGIIPSQSCSRHIHIALTCSSIIQQLFYHDRKVVDAMVDNNAGTWYWCIVTSCCYLLLVLLFHEKIRKSEPTAGGGSWQLLHSSSFKKPSGRTNDAINIASRRLILCPPGPLQEALIHSHDRFIK